MQRTAEHAPNGIKVTREKHGYLPMKFGWTKSEIFIKILKNHNYLELLKIT